MTDTKSFLKQVDLFNNLSEAMLDQVVPLGHTQSFPADQIVIERNSPPDNFYLIQNGTVQIITAPPGETQRLANAARILLGTGQSFGEMGLVDSGTRSATVKTTTDTILLAFDCQLFRELCSSDTDLGYLVMRNIAADLSFKLRYRNLI